MLAVQHALSCHGEHCRAESYTEMSRFNFPRQFHEANHDPFFSLLQSTTFSPDRKVFLLDQALFCGVWHPYTYLVCLQTRRYWRGLTAVSPQPTSFCNNNNNNNNNSNNNNYQLHNIMAFQIWFIVYYDPH